MHIAMELGEIGSGMQTYACAAEMQEEIWDVQQSGTGIEGTETEEKLESKMEPRL